MHTDTYLWNFPDDLKLESAAMSFTLELTDPAEIYPSWGCLL